MSVPKDRSRPDQADQRRADEALQRLAAILEASDDAIFSTDAAGTITGWNPGAERLLGYTAAEVIGQNSLLSGTLPPDQQRLFRGERIAAFETKITAKDGRRIPVLIGASPMKDAEGRVVGTAAFVRDITEIRRAHEARLRLAAIVESSTDAIIAQDLNGTILSWNTGAENLYGYPSSEVLGRNISTLVPKDNADEIPEILERIKLGQRVEHYETVRCRKDRTPVDVSITVSPVYDLSGTIVGASSIARDVGEGRRTEAEIQKRLRSIFDSALDAVVTMDAAGVITDWNPMAETVFGWTRSEAVGRLVAETIIPPRYRGAHSVGLRRFLATGDGPVLNKRLELAALHRDGHEFPVELSISATLSGSSHIFSAYVRDITERHRAEEALRASEERYRQIVETAFEGVWIIDSNNRTTFVNHRMADMLGYPPEEMLGKPVLTFMDPDAQAAFAANRDQRQQAHQPEHEFRFRRKDGSELWALLEASPDQDAAGTYRGSLAMVTDVTERRRAEEKLRRLAAMVATSTDGIIAIDLNGSILNWNLGAERMYGYSPEEVIGQSVGAIVPEAQSDELTALLDRMRHGEPIEPIETLRRRKDGSLVEVSISFSPLTDVNGTVVASTAIHRDISIAKRAAEALRASEERYRRIVETAYEGIWVMDARNITAFVNPRMAEMLGYTVEEMAGRSVLDFLGADARASFASNLPDRLKGLSQQREVRYTRKDGTDCWTLLSVTPNLDEAGNYQGALAMVTDITERRRSQKALEDQALHDALTGLPNRLLLAERLAEALVSAKSLKQQVAILILDLDHFKEVNETFGLQAGDRLLEQVGPRLQKEIRARDLVARLGGDEFAVLLPDADVTAATTVAAHLLEAMERPFAVEGQHLDVAASMGIAIFPNDGEDPDTLLSRADIALFVAKQARGGFARYAPEQEKQGASRLALMAELRRALHDENQLFLEFQPLVRLRDRSLAGVEALVRWQHPERGLVPPLEFVPFAEKTRLIQPLTRWVLVSALRQCADWHQGGHAIPVSVNISMRDLVDPGFPELIATLLRAAHAQPSWLRLEITESLIMTEPERAINTLSQVRKLGVRLAVDDFGTGYSSLAYLHRLPIQEIKIDKSFVAAMAGEPSRANIVRASVELGHSLHLESVAEGVEDARTWDLLSVLACDMAQGYFISRPMPAEEVLPWLSKWESSSGRSVDRAA
jgi:diguanylate cyclase (GGDEF)-like protein/PAS domain S-box-containing protein